MKHKINRPNKVILHCAATPDSIESKFSVDDIDSWHKKRGWNGIGYHFYITRDGQAHKGRDVREIGAHTKGHNTNTIGVCYEGSHFPSAPQWDCLMNLYRTLRMTQNLQWNDWYGHKEFSDKDCPGFDPDILRKILSKVA